MMITTFVQRILSVSFSVIMLTQSSCLRDSYEVKISGPVTIGSEWIEFRPEPLLRADKDFHVVRLDLEPPFKDDFYDQGNGSNKGAGILMPDGEVINPEIEIIDQSGNVYKLVYAGSRRTFSPIYNRPSPGEFPRDREYKTVRIRSPKQIKCKAIYWLCESNKDLK